MKRIAIERLELDLRGVPHATAAAAARQIGPALAQAFGDRQLATTSAASIDTGRVALGVTPDANAIATHVARQIASKTSRQRS
jgi:hypothetical protein